MSLCQKNNIKTLCSYVFMSKKQHKKPMFLMSLCQKNNIKEAFCSVFVSTQVQAPRFTFFF